MDASIRMNCVSEYDVEIGLQKNSAKVMKLHVDTTLDSLFCKQTYKLPTQSLSFTIKPETQTLNSETNNHH